MDARPSSANPAMPPAVLFRPLPSPRTSTPWAFRFSRPDQSLQYLMHARFYGSSLGRFLKPDDGSDQDPSNPQSWNLYSYVKGNPVNFNDPTGHTSDDDLGQKADDEEKKKEEEKKKTETSTSNSNDDKKEQNQQEPTASGATGRQGGQGKGERNHAGKPEGTNKPSKHVKESKEHPGQYEVWDGHKGDWILKPKGWKPTPNQFSIPRSLQMLVGAGAAAAGVEWLGKLINGASKAAPATAGIGLVVITPENLPSRQMTEEEILAGSL